MKCAVAFAEFPTLYTEHPDAIGWTRYGGSILVECKASRSDFFADQKKTARRTPPEYQLGRRRFYVTPPGLIQPGELPPRWGLAEVYVSFVRVRVHAVAFDVYSHHREMSLLVLALQRHEIGRRWFHDQGRFENYMDFEARTR